MPWIRCAGRAIWTLHPKRFLTSPCPLLRYRTQRDDPAFAQELLEACLESVNEPGGREALLSTLRCYAEAKGMSTIAQQTGLSRESLYRSLSPSSNPTLSNLSAVFAAIQCELGVKVQVMVA